MTTAMIFFLLALYCVFAGLRRFTGQRPPMYIEKDPDITPAQARQWSRFNGYSMLFWAGFAALLGCGWLFELWLFLIPGAVCAAGGVAMALKGSSLLRKGRDTDRQ